MQIQPAPQAVPPDEEWPFGRPVKYLYSLARALKGWSLPACLVLVFGTILATAFYAFLLYESCQAGYPYYDWGAREYSCMKERWPLATLGGAILFPMGLFTVATFTSFWAWMGHAARRRRYRRHHGARLGESRNWFIRGEIDETEFSRLQAAWKPIVEGNFVGERARVGVISLIHLAVWSTLAAICFGLIAVLGLVFAIADGEGEALLAGALSAPAAIGFSIVAGVGFLQGPAMFRAARQLQRETLEGAERAESQVLAQIGARARGAPFPRTAAGPSFSPFVAAKARKGAGK